MPGTFNLPDVRVSITADNRTAEGIAQAKAGLDRLRTASGATWTQGRADIEQARGAAELFANQTGVVIPRELRKVLAQSALLGPALKAAFSGAAAIGFIMIADQAIDKVREWSQELAGWGKAEQERYAKLVAFNHDAATAAERLRDAQREASIAGMDGADAVRGRLENLKQKQAELTAQLVVSVALWKTLQGQTSALQQPSPFKQLPGFTGDFLSLTAWTGSKLGFLGDPAESAAKTTAASERVLSLQNQIQTLTTEIQKAANELKKTLAGDGEAALKKLNSQLDRADDALASVYSWIAGKKAAGDPFAEIEQAATEQFNKLAEQIKQVPYAESETWRKAADAIIAIEQWKNDTILQKRIELLDKLGKIVETGPALNMPLGAGAPKYSASYGVQMTPGTQLDTMLHDTMLKLPNEIGTAWGNVFDSIIAGTGSVSEAFQRMGESIVAAIAQAITKMLMMYVMERLLASVFGGLMHFGNIEPLSLDMGTLGPYPYGGLVPGGGRAAGGPVSPGTAYLVGENGPELFVPAASGSIAPGGAAGPVPFELHLHNEGPPMAARTQKTRWDGKKFVVDAVLENLANHGDLYDALKR